MIFFRAVPLLLLLAAAAPDERPIVVTGTRLVDTGKALDACLARLCPPAEDIRATLAHAENLFVAGDYRGARRIVDEAIGRNHRHGAAFPGPVSDLHRVRGRIAAHLGDERAMTTAAYASRQVLRRGVAPDDPRHVNAQVEVADMHAAKGNLARAADGYEAAIKAAERIGRPDLAAIVAVRGAWLHLLDDRPDLARGKLRRIAADTRPETRIGRLTAQILLARMTAKRGKSATFESLQAELAAASRSPILVYSPPLDLLPDPAGQSAPRAGDPYQDRWIDIGFLVTPEGKAAEIEILRQGAPADWAAPLLKAIGKRIYSPSADTERHYRIERYTYTAFWNQQPTGTRLPVRGSQPRIEYLDLTPDLPQAPGGAS